MFKGLILCAAMFAGSALAAGAAADFEYTPVPRWQTEPGSEALCEAMRRECPDMAALPEIGTSVEYDELYDAAGMLVGLRLTRGSGCAPFDENQLVSHREFRAGFHDSGRPDLQDQIRLELRPGVDPAAVRIVKPVEMNISMSCAS